MPGRREQPPKRAGSGPLSVGIGWRQPHYRDLLETKPSVSFVEVHSENFFGSGGAAIAVLERARENYPVSLHGVGLSLGSVAGLDKEHLDQLRRLVDRIEPMLVSDHASFARAALPGTASLVHAADLLPIPFSRAALDVLCSNVAQVQEKLRRPMLVENLSAYVVSPGSEMAEEEFLSDLARRTGCRLLLDINNLYVNARNAGLRAEAGDPVQRVRDTLKALAPDLIGEIHLAGHSEVAEAGISMVIDDHGSRVCNDVWTLYSAALEKFGAKPTLVEWDTAIPPLSVLLEEAERARQFSFVAEKTTRE